MTVGNETCDAHMQIVSSAEHFDSRVVEDVADICGVRVKDDQHLKQTVLANTDANQTTAGTTTAGTTC
jgi:hypothetical protein